MLTFQIMRGTHPPATGVNQVYLFYDKWNDFSFVTMFYVRAHDENGNLHDLGNVKIGFKGQTKETQTASAIQSPFESLPTNYFSLGIEAKYYRVLGHDVSVEFRDNFTRSLRDVVASPEAYNDAGGEEVYRTSLLRDVTITTIEGQFRNILRGNAPLTEYKFIYERPGDTETAGIKLRFDVTPESRPSTNIHAIIGRNGIGKTTLLNGMTAAILDRTNAKGKFLTQTWFKIDQIDDKYFSCLMTVAFSAFDPFSPPPEQADPEKGTRYFYIGLKDQQNDSGTHLKPIEALHEEFIQCLNDCFRILSKRQRWLSAIQTLESDDNFARMGLARLIEHSGDELQKLAHNLVKRMSSGHAIVLLTITKLIAKVEEKTLVLLDEPESHLHPPLLAAFTRALNELLISQNGVAIIATHSPVVLQEVPKSCVWVLTRSGLEMSTERPEVETFGENVGILTREVFGLEVAKSGFHSLLYDAVFKEQKTYAQVVSDYGDQLGFEAKSILKALVIDRDREASRG